MGVLHGSKAHKAMQWRRYRRFLIICVPVMLIFVLISAFSGTYVQPELLLDDWKEVSDERFVREADLNLVASAVGGRIQVGSTLYAEALERAELEASHLHNTREYQIDLDQYLWRFNRHAIDMYHCSLAQFADRMQEEARGGVPGIP